MTNATEDDGDYIISQHVGWLKQCIGGMAPENWRDMRGFAEAQLETLSQFLSTRSTSKEGGAWSEPDSDGTQYRGVPNSLNVEIRKVATKPALLECALCAKGNVALHDHEDMWVHKVKSSDRNQYPICPNSGWISCDGVTECPVAADIRIQVKYRCGEISYGISHQYRWGNSPDHNKMLPVFDIIAYRVISAPSGEVSAQAEVRAELEARYAKPLADPGTPDAVMRQQIIQNCRAASTRDDCFDRLVPSDIRVLIGEIDRLSECLIAADHNLNLQQATIEQNRLAAQRGRLVEYDFVELANQVTAAITGRSYMNRLNEPKRSKAMQAIADEIRRVASTVTPTPDVVGELVKALEDVAAERKRQVQGEGWTAEHDDGHDFGEMARAAAAYAIAGSWPTDQEDANLARAMEVSLGMDSHTGREHLLASIRHVWPKEWDWSWWKPSNRRRNLVKAGALIIAEIERLDRIDAALARAKGEVE